MTIRRGLSYLRGVRLHVGRHSVVRVGVEFLSVQSQQVLDLAFS